ncbi:BEN domain-containing protein 6 isoform X1 [Garra rufa]|uniref:BEN domain-containing protein 6 isoform X1 n=1 Tax=Garra rufa TaxID=137080 RepID=UPI003CCEF0F1
MRRKTKAQRILDYENEEDEEEEQKPDCFSNGAQKRRKMYSSKEKSEENSSSDAGLQKLDMKVNELDCSSADLYADSPPASESEQEAHYLQSYSKKELIAMVLCMQREMEDLKEQLRCLTACGKLARNLEMLIEKTQMWSNGNNGISLGTPVSQGTPQTPAEADAVIPDVRSPPAVVNGQWLNQGPGPQKPHEATQNAQRDGLFTEFITPELLERCNTGTTAQKLTNDLLRGLYERECLASHSISGVVYNKRGQPKPALPTEEVQAILRTVQYFFPGKTDAEIKGYIRQKLQNEAKRLRKKPSLSGQYESRGLSLPLDMIDQN